MPTGIFSTGRSWPRTRCAMSASRLPSSSPRTATRPRTRRRAGRCRLQRPSRRGGLPRCAGAGRPERAPSSRRQSAGGIRDRLRRRRRRLRRRRAPGLRVAPPAQGARACDRVPRGRRRARSARRPPDGLAVQPGAARRAPRPGGGAGSRRAPDRRPRPPISAAVSGPSSSSIPRTSRSRTRRAGWGGPSSGSRTGASTSPPPPRSATSTGTWKRRSTGTGGCSRSGGR